MELDVEKLIDRFGSLQAAAKHYGFNKGVINNLRKKKTNSFKSGSKTFMLKNMLKNDGFYKTKQEVA